MVSCVKTMSEIIVLLLDVFIYLFQVLIYQPSGEKINHGIVKENWTKYFDLAICFEVSSSGLQLFLIWTGSSYLSAATSSSSVMYVGMICPCAQPTSRFLGDYCPDSTTFRDGIGSSSSSGAMRPCAQSACKEWSCVEPSHAPFHGVMRGFSMCGVRPLLRLQCTRSNFTHIQFYARRKKTTPSFS